MPVLRVFLIFLLFGGSVLAQSSADQWLEEANQLRRAGRFTEAIELLEKAIPAFEQNGEDEQVIEAQNLLAWTTFFLGKFKEAEDIHLRNWAFITSRSGEYPRAIADVHYGLSATAGQQGHTDEAVSQGRKAIELLKEVDSTAVKLVDYYNGLAIAYQQKSDPQEALNWQLLALEKKKEIYGEVHPGTAKSYNNIGVIYRDMGDLEKALQNYHYSLNIKRQLFGEVHPSISSTYNNISQLHRDKGEYPQALKVLEKALAIELEVFGEDSYFIGEKYAVLASINYQAGAYQVAHSWNQKALTVWQQLLGQKHPNISRAWQLNAEVFRQLEDYGTALEMAQKAVAARLINYQADDADRLPERTELIDDKDLMVALVTMGDIYRERPKEQDSAIDLATALELYELASHTVDLLREEYREENSKLFLLEKATELYEAAIDVCFELWQFTNEVSHLHRAFIFSEKNKSVLLQASIRAEEAFQYAGFPAERVAENEQLKRNIVARSGKFYRAQEEGLNRDSLVLFRQSLFAAKDQHRRFLETMEAEYPAYSKLKYQYHALEVKELQGHLAAGEVLVEYFWGAEKLYRFTITREGITVKRSDDLAQLESEIQSFTDLLNDNTLATNRGNDPALQLQFIQQSHRLFSQLLSDLALNEVQLLTIIPDAYLFALPFDLLLTRLPEEGEEKDYSRLPYLLKEVPLRQLYTSQFVQPSGATTRAESLLAYAPRYAKGGNDFLATRSGFTSLAFTETEVNNICATTGGEAVYGMAATKERFLQQAPNYGVLHLAMHAYTNDEDPSLSGLVFADRSVTEGQSSLYAYELYKLQLQANLVVLSACNTGSGKLAKGEGTMSLARAFRHAGCPNVLMSLWQADDETTSELMTNFYRNLTLGQPKAAALQRAKLDLLAQSSRKNYPHYWGAFVLLGDNLPVYFSSPTFKTWYWGIALMAFLLLGLIARAFYRRSA